MKKYRRLIIIGLTLGIIVSVIITLLTDIQHLPERLVSFPWILMLPILGLRVLNWAVRFIKWHLYLWLVKIRTLPVKDSLSIFLFGFPLSASPGKAAEILKSFLLKSLTGTPVAATLPVVVAERFSDGIGVLLLLAWAIYNLSAAQYWSIVVASLSFFVVLILLLQNRKVCLWILQRVDKLPMIGRFARSFELFYESSYKIVLLRNVIPAVLVGFVANLLDGVGVYLILLGLGQAPSTTLFFQGLLVIGLSVVAGSVSGAPGGIGASDLTIAGSLIAVVHLSPAAAGFATLLARFVQFWWGAIIGGLVGFAARKRLFTPALDQIIEREAEQELQTI